MAARGFAAAPTAEQDGAYTIHQTITCHYHVYAPTTVHASSDRPRCVTESTSAASSENVPPTSAPQPSSKDDGNSDHNPAPESGTEANLEGKRQAILRWLIEKLAGWLEKVSH